MTAELDTTRVVRAWLEEGGTRLPDHVLSMPCWRTSRLPPQRRSISAIPW